MEPEKTPIPIEDVMKDWCRANPEEARRAYRELLDAEATLSMNRSDAGPLLIIAAGIALMLVGVIRWFCWQ